MTDAERIAQAAQRAAQSLREVSALTADGNELALSMSRVIASTFDRFAIEIRKGTETA